MINKQRRQLDNIKSEFIFERPKWHTRAACRGVMTPNYHPHFPERGQSARPAIDNYCSGCPVKQECLDSVRELGATLIGIWGGKSGRDRRRGV